MNHCEKIKTNNHTHNSVFYIIKSMYSDNNNINYKTKIMEKLKLKIYLLFLLVVSNSFSQQAIVSSGGNAIGSGGSSSYSVGQLAYSYQTGSNGSVAQGVQQAFEIFTLNGQEFPEIFLEAKVYPNPVVNTLTLFIKNTDLENLNYQLYDIQGRQIINQPITSEETAITLEDNASGIYILKINSRTKEIKSFKIIKN